MRKNSFFAAAFAALASFSCATKGPNKGDFNLISMDQERAMGKQIDAEVRKEYKVIDDPQAVAYLTQLGTRILKGAPAKPADFTFHVVEDEAINAFAVPGGQVYVNTGLIQAASTESELAGVLGHEMGHVISRHGTEQLSKVYGLNIIGSLALGENPGILAGLAAQVGGTALMLKYGRDAERESDKLAVKYTYAGGIDPRGIVAFFEKLRKEEKGNAPPKLLAWLSTHPLTGDRIRDAKARIAELPRKTVTRDTAAFQAFKARFAERVSSLAPAYR
jgi:beta-barrel assembly-enhancing protease